MAVVLGQMVGHAREAGVHVAAAQVLGRDHLAGGGLHQRRAAQEDGALLAHDDGLVAHRRHVGAAGGARAHHHRDLRDAHRRHRRLVVEDAAEVVAVREDLVLQRQEGAAGVDQIDAWQMVLQRDLLGAQVLLDRHGIVGAALHGGVVGDDQALHALDPADASDHAGRGRLVAVHPEGGHLADLQEGRARVEQVVDALARQQLAAGNMLGPCGLAAAQRHLRRLRAQVLDQRAHLRGIGPEVLRARIDLALQHLHGGVLSRSR